MFSPKKTTNYSTTGLQVQCQFPVRIITQYYKLQKYISCRQSLVGISETDERGGNEIFIAFSRILSSQT